MIYHRFLYRPLMRLLHRFNLHYAPPNCALTNDAGWPLHWCQWCGMRDFVMPPIKPGEAELPIKKSMGTEALYAEVTSNPSAAPTYRGMR